MRGRGEGEDEDGDADVSCGFAHCFGGKVTIFRTISDQKNPFGLLLVRCRYECVVDWVFGIIHGKHVSSLQLLQGFHGFNNTDVALFGAVDQLVFTPPSIASAELPEIHAGNIDFISDVPHELIADQDRFLPQGRAIDAQHRIRRIDYDTNFGGVVPEMKIIR
ncbi:MAG: Uncharacterised protein [Pseudidiomarina mangrovi]|nr:MAG: Uncharacterised protein [Pseudidiomarina mangrovi]